MANYLGRTDEEVARIQAERGAARKAFLLAMRELAWFAVIEGAIASWKGTLLEALQDVDRIVVAAIEDGAFDDHILTNPKFRNTYFSLWGPEEAETFNYTDTYRPEIATCLAEAIENAEKAALRVRDAEAASMGEMTPTNAENYRENLEVIEKAGRKHFTRKEALGQSMVEIAEKYKETEQIAAMVAEIRAKLYAPRQKVDFTGTMFE